MAPVHHRSSLDENKAFLTTADSAVRLLADATRPVLGWKGLEYRIAFPVLKPPGASFYPPDMDKMVRELLRSICYLNLTMNTILNDIKTQEHKYDIGSLHWLCRLLMITSELCLTSFMHDI